MTIDTILSRPIIGPLLLLYETVFALGSRVLRAGPALILMSLVVYLLFLPLFRRTRMIGRTGSETKKKTVPGSPAQFLLFTWKNLLPILIQIPFLAASFQFINHSGVLKGAAFGLIQDLSGPDQLLQAGGRALNLMPVLMGVLGLASAFLSTRGKHWGFRILHGLAAILIPALLYSAPAGFTLVWAVTALLHLGENLISLIPGSRREAKPAPRFFRGKPSRAVFLSCALALCVLTGLLVPSALLAASPQEFIFSVDALPPVWQIVNTMLLAVGVFLVWTGMFYALSGRSVRRCIEIALLVLLGIFLVNYLFFRGNLGTISTSLQYDMPPAFTVLQKVLNLVVLAAVSSGLIWLAVKKEDLIRIYALILTGAMFGLSAWNVYLIQDASARTFRMLNRNYEGAAEIPFSRTKENVIVLMLDRAISSYIPCMIQEMPELAETYSGFTYYPNTLSFGMHTNLGAPALFGGYEYTPAAMNARPELLLRDKHNEALLLLPTLFQGKGYQVTVFDVPYPGDYSESGDYSVFDHLENTNARIIHSLDSGNGKWERPEDLLLRNLFCYSLTTCSPNVLYGPLYNMGNYNRAEGTPSLLAVKEIPPVYEDLDVTPSFLADYEVLKNLREMTRISDSNENGTFLMMVNCMTHTPALLKEPEYEPGYQVNNADYDAAHRDRFLAGPLELQANGSLHMAQYQVDMAAMRMVGDWLNLLKEEGVYDNTRIIIAADHGFWLRQIEEGKMKESNEDIMGYNPLLMVKDFQADGPLKTDNVFMTNADVPTLALESLIENPKNPFTGKPISSEAKKETQYVSISHEAFVSTNHGTAFLPSKWYAVDPGGETLFDQTRWHYLPEMK